MQPLWSYTHEELQTVEQPGKHDYKIGKWKRLRVPRAKMREDVCKVCKHARRTFRRKKPDGSYTEPFRMPETPEEKMCWGKR